jgi:Leucine-rich repeat (LRR) protein
MRASGQLIEPDDLSDILNADEIEALEEIKAVEVDSRRIVGPAVRVYVEKTGQLFLSFQRKLTARDSAPLRRISKLGTILFLPGESSFTDDQFQYLEGVGMKALHHPRSVTDEGLKRLKTFPKLEKLGLVSTAITDGGLAALRDVPHLNSLFISGTDITDAGLKTIGTLDALKIFSLDTCANITDEGVSSLRNVESLYLNHNRRLTSAAFVRMAALTKLTDIGLGGIATAEGDEANYLAALKSLKDRKDFKKLNLHEMSIGDNFVKELQVLKDLESLGLSYTAITDSAMEYISQLKNLSELDLHGTAITDSGLAYVAQLKKLSGLYLYETAITDEGMVHLKGLTELQNLALNKTSVGDDGLKELQDLKNLEILFLGETSITDLGLEYVAKFSKLSRLDVSRTAVTKAGMERLQESLPDCRVSGDPRRP